MRRRVLRRPADPRHRRRLVRARVPGVRLPRIPSAGARLQILDETVEVVKRLWTEETVTFQGKHLVVRRRVLRPEADPAAARDLDRRRRREGHAAHRGASTPTRRTGRPGIEGFVRKSGLLEQYCDEIGRDFDSIVRTHGPDCRVFDTEADLQRWLDSPGGGSLWGAVAARRVRARQLRRHRRAGRREGAGVRRRRLSRVRAVVPRLPVVREPRGVRARRRSARQGLSAAPSRVEACTTARCYLLAP